MVVFSNQKKCIHGAQGRRNGSDYTFRAVKRRNGEGPT
jgi:hypothetical protein